jgi:DNA-directed RNA polymerase subunit beta'
MRQSLEAQMLMLGIAQHPQPCQRSAPITVPSQDMVLGLYYITKLTQEHRINQGQGLKAPSSTDTEEAQIAYNEGKCTLHAIVSVVVDDIDENGNPRLRY